MPSRMAMMKKRSREDEEDNLLIAVTQKHQVFDEQFYHSVSHQLLGKLVNSGNHISVEHKLWKISYETRSRLDRVAEAAILFLSKIRYAADSHARARNRLRNGTIAFDTLSWELERETNQPNIKTILY